MYSKDGLYSLFRELKLFLRKPTPGKYKHLMENKFDYYLTHYFKTPNWDKGANQYITLANALNSGNITLMEVVSACIGKYILKFKQLTNSEFNSIDKIKEFARFYTIKETKAHFEYIRKLNEELSKDRESIEGFTENKINVYQVNEEQKNTLYDLIREGKVNFYCFIYAWEKGKFEIDEKKITDENYLHFIHCMSIVRQNITKKVKP